MQYDAFISYNHAADGALAPALQDALQHLAKPWYRRRAMTVFRDETNLSASPELFEAIEDALSESRYYVLLASPGSARSQWVGKEIGFWLATKTAASLRVLLVLTDGELHWDQAANRFDPARSTALHPALVDAFASEPLHVDLREARAALGDGKARQRLNFRRLYRHPVAKVAARIRGVDPDAIEGEDLRQHRRTLAIAWAAALALVLLTVVAIGAFVAARRSAQQARAEAKTAQSGELAGRARDVLSDDPPQALALAVAAYDRASSSLADSALRAAGAVPITRVFGPLGGRPSNDTHPVAISADGSHVVTTDGRSRVAVWDVGRKVKPMMLDRRGAGRVVSATFSGDGNRLAVSYRSTGMTGDTFTSSGEIVVWDVRRGSPLAHWKETDGYATSVALSRDGVTLAAGVNASLVLWNIDTGARREAATGAPGVRSVATTRDGRLVATATGASDSSTSSDGGNVVLWDSTTGARLTDLPVGTLDVRAAAFSPDGRLLVSGDDRGRLEIWDTTTGALAQTWNDGSVVVSVAFDPTGGLVLSGDDDGTTIVRSASDGSVLDRWTDGVSVTGVAFAERGHLVVTGDEQGRAVVRDTRRLLTETSLDAPVLRLAFDARGSTLTAFSPSTLPDESRAVTMWNLGDSARRTLADDASDVATSADGRFLALLRVRSTTLSLRADVTIVDLASGSPVHEWSVDDFVSGVAISPDGSRVVTSEGFASPSALTVRDAVSGSIVRRIPKLSSSTGLPSVFQPGPQIAVGPGARSIATVEAGDLASSAPNRDRMHSLVRSKTVSSTTVVMSRDGRTLATIDAPFGSPLNASSQVVLRTPATGQTVKVDLPGIHPSVVVFSPDGRALAIGDTRRGVTLWDLARRQTITTWKLGGAVTSVAFSPDGRQLAAGDAAGHVARWDVSAYLTPAPRVRARLCRALDGYGEPQTWQTAVPFLSFSGLCR